MPFRVSILYYNTIIQYNNTYDCLNISLPTIHRYIIILLLYGQQIKCTTTRMFISAY